MKTKLIIILLSIFMIHGTRLTAQKFGVITGINFTDIQAKSSEPGFNDHSKTALRAQLGMIADIKVKGKFSVQTGLGVSTKGYRVNDNHSYYGIKSEIKGNFTLIYAELPVTAKFTQPAGKFEVYGLFGAVPAVGIYGYYRYKLNIDGERDTESGDIKYGNKDESDLKRPDVGLKIGGGVQYKFMQIGLAYTLGLLDISNTDGYTQKNRMLALTFGVLFGK